MNDTFISTLDYKKRKWFVIDCKDQHLGRLSSSIVAILSGKIKSYYYPSSDLGDYVILINAESLIINLKDDRYSVFSPGRPGRSLKKIVNPVPKQIIESCVRCMIPEGKLRRNLNNRLKVYPGSTHPHQAQNPITLNPKKFELEKFYNDF